MVLDARVLIAHRDLVMLTISGLPALLHDAINKTPGHQSAHPARSPCRNRPSGAEFGLVQRCFASSKSGRFP